MSIDYAEIRKLIASGKCGEAELQIMHSFQGVGHANLVDALEQGASRAELEGDLDRADALYKLALAFFETCLPNQQTGGLTALRKYVEFLINQNRGNEAGEFLDRFAPMVMQVAREMTAEIEAVKAGHSA